MIHPLLKSKGSKPRKGKVFKCITCGKEYYKKPSHALLPTHFCSIKCRGIRDRKEESKEKKKCLYCGKEYEFYKCARRKPTYCSYSCKRLHQVIKNGGLQRMTVKCVVCGEAITKVPAHLRYRIKKTGIDNICCSYSCKHVHSIQKNGISRLKCGSHRGFKSGMREDIGIYVRSGWEANYARYLNLLKSYGGIQSWEYEPETFWFEGIKRGSRGYCPDFKVTGKDGNIIYHEVKGYMQERDKTKMKRMEKYHPNIKIILIREREMNEIKKKVGRLIQWE